MSGVYVRIMDTQAKHGVAMTEKTNAIRIAYRSIEIDLTLDEAKALRKYLTVLILRAEARPKGPEPVESKK